MSKCLTEWLGVEREKRSGIAVNGKTIRGSGNGRHRLYHVVGAFVAENQITLGELVVEEKSNEITAVPELLNMLDIEDAIITADAMRCQRAIVQTISAHQADYVLALKENQHELREIQSAIFPTARRISSERKRWKKGTDASSIANISF